MRRRTFLRTVGFLTLFVTFVAGVLIYLVRREPESYRAIPVPEGDQRRKLSGEFSSSVQQLIDKVGTPTEESWSGTFTADQMNSYFEEDFVRVKPFKLPEGLHSPRVAIRPGHLQLAFRYGEGFWSTVVSLDVNIWLVANEANVVAVEVLGLHAGTMPISMQSLLQQVADNARQFNVDVTWYRRDGHPVALVRFQSDRPTPSMLIQRLELQEGRIVVEGKSKEQLQHRPLLSMTP